MNYDKRNAIVFFPGFDQVTGSAESVLFLKNQNEVILVKKKGQRVCNQVLPGHTRFFLPSFFLQPDLVPAPDRPDPGSTHRIGPVSKL
jgi:hypothetical protein